MNKVKRMEDHASFLILKASIGKVVISGGFFLTIFMISIKSDVTTI